MRTRPIFSYPDNYEVRVYGRGALRAERITCRRHRFTRLPASKKRTICAAGKHAGHRDPHGGILEIKLPCLLPKRQAAPESGVFCWTVHHRALTIMPLTTQCRSSGIVAVPPYLCAGAAGAPHPYYDNLELKQFHRVAASFYARPVTAGCWRCLHHNTTGWGMRIAQRLFLMDCTIPCLACRAPEQR